MSISIIADADMIFLIFSHFLTAIHIPYNYIAKY